MLDQSEARQADGMVTQPIRHLEAWANPRTVVVLTLLLLGALWTTVIVSAVSARDASIASTGELLQRLNHALEEETRQQFRLADTFLATCEHWLQTNPARDPRSNAAFRKLVEGFRSRTAQSIDILLLAADGEAFDVLESSRRPLENAAGSHFLKDALASPGLFIGAPTLNPLRGHYGLPIALALHRPAHGIQLLLAVIDLPTLTRTYDEQRHQPGGAITLLRLDGTVLARAPDDTPRLGQSLANSRLFTQHLRQQPRAFVLLDDGANQAKELVSYSSMHDFPLLIMVSADYDEVLTPWLRQTLWVFLLALGVTVPLAVVAYRSLRLLQALANQDGQLQQLMTTDQLTGISSRKHLIDTLNHELNRAHRYRSPLSFLLLDIDFFQRINDGYGHAVGDQVLIEFAHAAKKDLRDMDLLGRLGGGEFALLLPNTEVNEAIPIAERVRAAIARISIPSDNGTVQFTVSVGASQASPTDRSIDDLLKRATEALHKAKAAGHDQLAIV